MLLERPDRLRSELIAWLGVGSSLKPALYTAAAQEVPEMVARKDAAAAGRPRRGAGRKANKENAS